MIYTYLIHARHFDNGNLDMNRSDNFQGPYSHYLKMGYHYIFLHLTYGFGILFI